MWRARRDRLDLLRLAAGMVFGKFSANQFLDNSVAREIDIALGAPQVSASVDGEIVSLETPLRCRLHRGRLRVLRPREAPSAKA